MRDDDLERLVNAALMHCRCIAVAELADRECSVKAVSNAGRTVARAHADVRACLVRCCVRAELACAAVAHLRRHGTIASVRQRRHKRALLYLRNAARRGRSAAVEGARRGCRCAMSHASRALCHTRAVHYVTRVLCTMSQACCALCHTNLLARAVGSIQVVDRLRDAATLVGESVRAWQLRGAIEQRTWIKRQAYASVAALCDAKGGGA